MFRKLVAYANAKGSTAGRPYFSADGKTPLTERQWSRLRAKFQCAVGVTDVWREPQVSGAERTLRRAYHRVDGHRCQPARDRSRWVR